MSGFMMVMDVIEKLWKSWSRKGYMKEMYHRKMARTLSMASQGFPSRFPPLLPGGTSSSWVVCITYAFSLFFIYFFRPTAKKNNSSFLGDDATAGFILV